LAQGPGIIPLPLPRVVLEEIGQLSLLLQLLLLRPVWLSLFTPLRKLLRSRLYRRSCVMC
jgi:hypothetical protein